MTPAGQETTQASSNQQVELPEGLLDRIVDDANVGQNADERKMGREWVEAYLTEILSNQIRTSKSTGEAIDERIAQVDKLLSDQLNEVLHAPKFQELESAWRGLRYLVDQTETSTQLKIKVMNVSKDDLLDDLRANDFDQSATFRKVYEEEFGVLGGSPFGALVGDYYFGRGPQDIQLLGKMSQVAAAAHAPFISGTSAEMFGWKDFTQLADKPDLAKIFDNANYAGWNSFRQSEDSRYVGLVMPHILMRLPYGENTEPVKAFKFEEDVSGADHKKYLWGNAAYAFASRLTNAYAQHEWCAAIRGVMGGGLVEGLPVHTFPTDDGDIAMKCPTELAITDRREAELSKLGFIPLCHHKGSDRAVFFGAQTCNKPVAYLDNDANANARLSAQLQYIMATSRFAHFLKVMMRDRIGSFMSRDSCETFLNQWIAHYVLLDDSASHEQKAKFPLREARIEVAEVAGKPGAYTAVAFLRPHFQLEELTVSLRLVAKLPEPKG